MTAGMSSCAPRFHRTVAIAFSSETAALLTPGTPWMASVTWRAQLLQLIPLT